jgi:hypothetical protein
MKFLSNSRGRLWGHPLNYKYLSPAMMLLKGIVATLAVSPNFPFVPFNNGYMDVVFLVCFIGKYPTAKKYAMHEAT